MIEGKREEMDANAHIAATDAFPANHYRLKYGIQADTLKKSRQRGRLSGTKRGGRWFYSIADVQKLWPDAFD